MMENRHGNPRKPTAGEQTEGGKDSEILHCIQVLFGLNISTDYNRTEGLTQWTEKFRNF